MYLARKVIPGPIIPGNKPDPYAIDDYRLSVSKAGSAVVSVEVHERLVRAAEMLRVRVNAAGHKSAGIVVRVSDSKPCYACIADAAMPEEDHERAPRLRRKKVKMGQYVKTMMCKSCKHNHIVTANEEKVTEAPCMNTDCTCHPFRAVDWAELWSDWAEYQVIHPNVALIQGARLAWVKRDADANAKKLHAGERITVKVSGVVIYEAVGQLAELVKRCWNCKEEFRTYYDSQRYCKQRCNAQAKAKRQATKAKCQ